MFAYRTTDLDIADPQSGREHGWVTVIARPRTEGERWAREELARLRDRRFTAPAVAAFLRASGRRSAQIRRARPALARRARAWSAAGAAAHVAWAGRDARRRRDGLVWWAVVAAMLDWHLGMFETEDGRARDLAAADALTLARAWLVPVVRHGPSPGIVAAAAASDVLDGILARRAGPTRAGRDLEGLVDACFAASALRGARARGAIGPSAARVELVRLGTGFGYATATWFGRTEPPSRALLGAARAATALRTGGLLAGVAGHRRFGEALLLTGSAASVGLTVREVMRGRVGDRDARHGSRAR